MVFCFVQNFFLGQHELDYLFFLSHKAQFFSLQNSTLGYMTKTLNQIIFFFLHQNQNIFFSNIGNQNIFLEKKQNIALKLDKNFLAVDKDVLYVFHIFHTKNLILITICETDFHDVIEDIIND